MPFDRGRPTALPAREAGAFAAAGEDGLTHASEGDVGPPVDPPETTRKAVAEPVG